MKTLKLAVLASFLACGAAHAASATLTDNADQRPASVQPAQCDSASFAAGSAKNRQLCRKEFARAARPTVQTAPLSASDYAS